MFNKIRKKIAAIYTGWLSSTVAVEETEIKVAERHNVTDPDFIDYDGMGNQGRFPSSRKR